MLPMPEAHDQEGGEDVAGVARARLELGEADHGQGAHGHPERHQRPRSDLVSSLMLTVVAVIMIAPVMGRKARPVWIGVRPFVSLQEVRQEQEDGEHRDAGDADRQVRAAAGAVGDHAQRQQRVRRPRLGDGEAPEQDDRGGQGDDRDRVAPGVRLGVREAVDQGEEAAGGSRVPGTSIGGRSACTSLTSRRSAASAAGTANRRFTYRHQRQDSISVRMPPSSRPTAAPPPAMAPKMPNAFPRSAGW